MKNKKNNSNDIPKVVKETSSSPTPKSKVLLLFLVKFALLFLAFELCYFNDFLYNHVFFPVNKMFAFAGSKCLNLLALHTHSSGDSIINDKFSISVKQGCDSLEALAIFVCGVIAFPARMKVKISGLLLGSFIILSLNLVRLVHLFWVGLYHYNLFDLFHLEIWQGFFIVLSVVLWVLWVIQAVKPIKVSDHA